MIYNLREDKERAEELIELVDGVRFQNPKDHWSGRSFWARCKREGFHGIANIIDNHRAALADDENPRLAENDSDVMERIRMGMRTAVRAWKPRPQIGEKDLGLAEGVASSACRVYNEVQRVYGLLVAHHPFGNPPGSDELGWDAACELSARPWSRYSSPRFGIDAQVLVGHDLRRLTVHFTASGFDRIAAWKELVIEPLEAYQREISAVAGFKSMIDVTAGIVADKIKWDSSAATGALDLIIVALDQLLGIKKGKEVPRKSLPMQKKVLQGLDDLLEAHPIVKESGAGPCALLRVLIADGHRQWSQRGLADSEDLRGLLASESASATSVSRWLDILASEGLVQSIGKKTPKRWMAGEKCWKLMARE